MTEKNNDFDIVNITPPTLDTINLHGKLNIRKMIDKIMRDAGYGSMSSINYLTLRGFNYQRHGQQQVHANRDNMGYTFFTRPILNFTYDNLSASDRLAQLRNSNPKSLQRYVRTLLDPWGQMKSELANDKSLTDNYQKADMNERSTPLVDPANPFMPILSNTLTSLSGWKDVTLNDFESSAGYHNEKWSMMDGFFDVVDTFELSSDFRNIEGDPISLLFQSWEEYMVRCREGTLNPYPIFVAQREFDYNTKIYRFVMDHTKTYIQKWAATIAWPSSVPHGNQFNFSVDKQFSDSVQSVPITWKCVGADYNNPKIFFEFNELVAMYAPGLAVQHEKYDYKNNSLTVRNMDEWIKLKPHEKNRGNFLAIPLINYVTNELEWWVRSSDYYQYILVTEEEKRDVYEKTYRTQTVGEKDKGFSWSDFDDPNDDTPKFSGFTQI